jgi:hypothetical protein
MCAFFRTNVFLLKRSGAEIEMIPSLRRLKSKWKTVETKQQEPQENEGNEMESPGTQEQVGGRGGTNVRQYSGKVYPQNPNLSLSIPSSTAGEENHHGKKAGDAFELDELFDLNGENFWYYHFHSSSCPFHLLNRRDWEAAGGDPDEYFKETLPNYGLVSTLFLTISIPGSIYNPPFDFQQNSPSKHKFYVSVYVSFPLPISSLSSSLSPSPSLSLRLVDLHVYYYNDFTFLHTPGHWNPSAVCQRLLQTSESGLRLQVRLHGRGPHHALGARSCVSLGSHELCLPCDL